MAIQDEDEVTTSTGKDFAGTDCDHRWGDGDDDSYVWDDRGGYSRERFKDAGKDLLNNGDMFSLTQPKMICDIHRRFLEAGADILETNTFGATSISQSEFFVEDPREHGGRKDPEFYQKILEDSSLRNLAWEINETSARQCREWADRVGNETGRQRFVAGAIGPLTVSLSNSPDADDAGFRVVTFDPGEDGLYGAGAGVD